MNIDILLNADSPIPSHAIIAIAAVVIGAIQFAQPKGTRSHKFLGYTWVTLLTYVAISGLFIHSIQVIGPFSPIHILSVITLIVLFRAVNAARKKEIKKHKIIMINLYGLALILTGAFTFLPGRIMYKVVTGG